MNRSTAWFVLNRDNGAGPSATIIKRILSSPYLPPLVRRKMNEYVDEKIAGLYGHSNAKNAFVSRSISRVPLLNRTNRKGPLTRRLGRAPAQRGAATIVVRHARTSEGRFQGALERGFRFYARHARCVAWRRPRRFAISLVSKRIETSRTMDRSAKKSCPVLS